MIAEFINSNTQILYPESVLHKLLIEPIEIDFRPENQIYSYSYNASLDLTVNRGIEPVIWTLPDAYHYHLQEVRIEQIGDIDALAKVQLYNRFRARTVNDTPIQINLITTPIKSGIIRYAQNINTTFFAHSTIDVEFTNLFGIDEINIQCTGLRIPKKWLLNY